MPPNVLPCWDSSKRHRICVDNNADDYHGHFSPHDPESGRTLWKKILQRNVNAAPYVDNKEVDSGLLASLSSIIILNDDAEGNEWLERFQGRLSHVSTELLEGLRKHAPGMNRMSTVADFNDNLFYHMQQERGLEHLGSLNSSNVEELESILQANEYLGSFLTTKNSLPQPAHVDYPWEVLEKHAADQSLRIGFFPLTREGMFLQIWPTVSPSEEPVTEVEGQIIFIPHGKLLTVPANTIHGGGFRTTPVRRLNDCNDHGDNGGNLRFHLYVATNQASLPVHQTNKYTEPNDKRKELSRRYVDSRHMNVLLENLFV